MSTTKPDLQTAESHRNGRRLNRYARKLKRDLAQVRADRGFSKSSVADAIGIDRSGITRFEFLETNPRLETILRYAHAVGAVITFTVEKTEDFEIREEHEEMASRLDEIQIESNSKSFEIPRQKLWVGAMTTSPSKIKPFRIHTYENTSYSIADIK